MKVVFECKRNTPLGNGRHEVTFFPVRPERGDVDHPNAKLWGPNTVPVGSLNLVLEAEAAGEIEVGKVVELDL